MAAAVPPTVQQTLTKFPRSSLIAGKPCGQGGAFGNVISGTLDKKFVVVKILHAPIAKKKVSVLQQMIKLEHRNLVRFMGVIDLDPNDCPQLIFKNANKGNLVEWLKDAKNPSDDKTLHKFVCDVINGMEYLHNMDFVHGSLAARNILIDEFIHTSAGTTSITYVNAKISDYGMTRIMEGMGPNYYKMATGRTLPIRWMPKEAILTDNCSGEVKKSSDIWSFAVLLWEMWTKAEVPYGLTVSNTEVRQHILDGSSPLTFHRPANCPDNVMNVMKNIFKVNQSDRPTFSDLNKSFNSLQGGKQPFKKNKPVEANPGKGRNEPPNNFGPGKNPNFKPSNPKKDRTEQYSSNKKSNVMEEGKPVGYPGQKNFNHQKKAESKQDMAPPPYTPLVGQMPPPQQQHMGYNQPQPGFPSAGVGMPHYHPQQMPMGMGPYSYSTPPPNYAAATAVETSEMQAQTIRDLQNKISLLEMKQLESKVQDLESQQRRQQRKDCKPQQAREKRGKSASRQQGSSRGQPNSQNTGQQQGQGFEMPGWMQGATIAGIAAGAAVAAAAKNSEGRGRRK